MLPALRHNREYYRLTRGALGRIGTPPGVRTGTGTTATTLSTPAGDIVLPGLAVGTVRGDMVAAAMVAVGTVAADTSAVRHGPGSLATRQWFRYG